jgi:hypothetical protein
MKKYSVVSCNCGAVTISNNEDHTQVSMPMLDYKIELRPLLVESLIDDDFDPTHNCNYCVNHWGTDLCACGSGKHPEDCEDSPQYEDCGQPYYLFTAIL